MPEGSTGGKKVTGRKRQLLVDTAGNLLAVQVQPAGIADGPGARGVLTQALRLVPTVRKLWADSAYNAEALSAWLAEHWPQLDLEIVRRAEGTAGFAVQPRRWVVERSFAWLGLNRLLSKEYERLPWHAEGWILLASISLLLNH
jgi:putative transposase